MVVLLEWKYHASWYFFTLKYTDITVSVLSAGTIVKMVGSSDLITSPWHLVLNKCIQ